MLFSNSFLLKNVLNKVQRPTFPLFKTIREGHTIRGESPGIARSLEQRLQEENVQDPELSKRINIGFPKLRNSRSQQLKERIQHLKKQRQNPDLEKKARSNTLLIDLEQVNKEYRATTAAFDIRVVADHYGIYNDLFGDAYFIPRVNLNVTYNLTETMASPVYNGNMLKPCETSHQPEVLFDGKTDPITGKKTEDYSFWTLLATNPDWHLNGNKTECLHWFIANIPNGDVERGEVLVRYLQPFPPKGIGYQRFVFVLYKQNSKLDFNSYKISESDYNNLEKRTFETKDFYRKYQDVITPAGLAFFQTDWDNTLTEFYHNILDMKEPIFEYDFPAPYLADQKWFPLKQPFNLYMDKHRDIKQVNKEYLERKLAKTHPFDGPEKPLRFPNAHPLRDLASWQKTEIRKERLRIGRINDY